MTACVVGDGVRAAAAAVSFLTAVPIRGRAEIEEHDLRRGAVLFPLVGALVGAAAALVAWAGSFVVPPLAAAVLSVAVATALTAALHLDGLADVADGIGAGLTGQDPLKAMRDPNVGTFGVVALVLDLGLKVSVTAALVAGERFPVEIVVATGLSRVSPLWLAATIPPANPGTGIGAWTAGVGLRTAVVALAMAAAVGIPLVGVTFAAFVATGAVVCASMGWWTTRVLGGTTGDVFGAGVELTETLAVTVALGLR